MKYVKIKLFDYTHSREKHLISLLMLFIAQLKNTKSQRKLLAFVVTTPTLVGVELAIETQKQGSEDMMI
jgi:hypothetical protein